ncbi:DUF418 domain-containing protein [Halalkalibacterium halodurans]|uniref:BH0756 protein n=1 Tax=Halalkalibacterium halodurans (strain ATCC BAA-125 / DSM 18197 / FERM 7344 / JCM 9153 / C-125) TaxID=272558 RepID=Q9KEU3_HALH5|nr:DUF418 domain-containing protein [Halalkalibacterium halodurans]MED4080382.1 DUF418 domain-containing protein [Halalkalibacterium halodurans]MED4084554.1 DUF418 domain-containing protein [Halalkalibacterium halodurans]MED4104882.1 DUF418 domain-containing protein [Halalkalibacterium halodurans]MED4109677.1 DUF418 domain-containing protein [Halalkalibacterium halodurans]MED4122913.1 DUF418 domain-containing protein [Halalkalibacterium halodurans]
MKALQPVAENERLPLLDVLRGVALLGILLVNMAHFSYPDLYLSFVGNEHFLSNTWHFTDHVTRFLLDVWIQMKFILLFSFLFGFGMAVMRERSLEKGTRFASMYVRRLIVLLLFGTVHAFFIWDGDILTDYALLGFVLLLFGRSKPKTLVIWALSLYLLFSIPFVLSSFVVETGENGMNEWEETMKAEYESEAKQALEVYSNGTFSEIATQRIHDRMTYMSINGMLTFNPFIYFFSSIPYFSMFLLGAAFAKARILHDPDKHQRIHRILWIIGFIIGIGGNLLAALSNQQLYLLIGAPFLMLFYVTTLTYLVTKTSIARWFHPFATVGRMAFTNYLCQSLICTFLFYRYGLGLYGSVGPFVGTLMAFAIFAFQMALSLLWFRRYRTGPLEWIWRSLTYKKRLPMKRTKAA